MTKPLPVKLGKEPLVEAVCQIRVTAKVALNTFFPGLLLAKHKADVSELQQLPASMLPEPIRAMQPEMAYMPLVRLRFKTVLVLIGERAITVSNPAPYLGWPNFRSLIIETFVALLESEQVSEIERCSLKYANVLKATENPDSLQALDWTLKIGQLDLNKQATTLRTEVLIDEMVTIITMSGGVTVQGEGREPVQGSLIDVDTIRQNKRGCDEFIASMSNELDVIRAANKKVFFECLTNEAIQALEPTYE